VSYLETIRQRPPLFDWEGSAPRSRRRPAPCRRRHRTTC